MTSESSTRRRRRGYRNDGLAFPDLRDEPTVIVQLMGRNRSPNAELDGWSHHWATYFPSLSEDKLTCVTFDREVLEEDNIEKMTHEDGEDDSQAYEDTALRETYKKCSTLRVIIPAKKPTSLHKGCAPVFVTVIAKKQLELVVNRERTVVVFGQIVVADESGIALVKFVNNSIQLSFNFVEIGDQLLFSSPTLCAVHPGCVFPNFGEGLKFLPGIIKVGEYECGHITRFKKNEVNSIFQFFSSSGKRLWNPSSVSHALSETTLSVDLIGVICHVSRFERRRKHTGPVLYADGNIEEEFVQFDISCWIELVDQHIKDPLPVLLRLGSSVWQKRDTLIPGSLIVITNVQVVPFNIKRLTEEECLQTCVQSTSFSQIYTNIDVEQYYKLMECEDVEGEIHEFVKKPNAEAILARKDVTWSLGGAYPLPVTESDAAKVIHLCLANSNTTDPIWPPWNYIPILPLFRRESQLVIFGGAILRYHCVQTTWDCSWSWRADPDFHEKRKLDTIYDPIPVNTSDFRLWFLWKRRLPEFRIAKAQDSSDLPVLAHQLQIYSSIERDLGHFAKAISMPAGVGKLLRKQPVVDGTPHYVLDILNHGADDSRLENFFWTWKPSRNLSILQIQEKLEKLRETEVLVIGKIHRTEAGADYRFGHDFMIHDILPI